MSEETFSETSEETLLDKYAAIDPVEYPIQLPEKYYNYDSDNPPNDDDGPRYRYDWYGDRICWRDQAMETQSETINQMYGIILHLEKCIDEKQKLIDDLLLVRIVNK
jgi:hypothetical protein